jgi:hypothetical protein
MTRLRFLKLSSLDRLRSNIAANQMRYAQAESFLNDYFAGTSWYVESSILMPDEIELHMPESKTEHLDLENTRIIYSALKHLTPLQASDQRLWAYFTHVSHWHYMRKRWPVDQYVAKDRPSERYKDYMNQRYLYMADRSRSLLRNGMARLWWYGYCTYDEKRSNPFELTGALLKKLDVAQNFAENAFGRNVDVIKTLLEVVLEHEFYERNPVRDLARYINSIGGVTIIDAIPRADLRELFSVKVAQLSVVA